VAKKDFDDSYYEVVRGSDIDVPAMPFGPVYDMWEYHRLKKTWHHQDNRYWLSRLVEEVGELSGVINGRHDHPIELELREIASICLSWLDKIDIQRDCPVIGITGLICRKCGAISDEPGGGDPGCDHEFPPFSYLL
jgi:hypothetical protein